MAGADTPSARRPGRQSAAETTGLKCAPETGPNNRISTARPNTVAVEFSNNCSPTSFGESRCAAIPDPTTTVTSRAVPVNSASSRRGSGTGWFTGRSPRGRRCREVPRELLQRIGDDPVVHPGASALTVEQSGGAQDLQMMGDGRLTQVDPDRQFADARLATGMAGDHAEQSQPHRVGQCLELDRQFGGGLGGQRLPRQGGNSATGCVRQFDARLRHTSILMDVESLHKRTLGELRSEDRGGVVSAVRRVAS